MLKKLATLIGGGKGTTLKLDIDRRGAPVPDEVKIALLVLLVEVSGKNGEVIDQEAQVLVHVGTHYLHLPEQDAVDLIGKARTARRKTGGIDAFAKLLNEHYDDTQKQLLLALSWKIIIADGEIDDVERKFATQVRYRLMLNAEQADEALEMASRDKI